MTTKTEHPVINGEFAKLGPSISAEQVASLLVSAFEGGSNYWYHDLHPVLPDGITYADFRKGGKFTSPTDYYHPLEIIPFVEGCALTLKDVEGDDPDKEYRIDREALQKGLRLFAEDEKMRHHWAAFISEDDDCITADVFLQFVVFGEVLYG